MRVFPIIFKAGCVELDAIVTVSDNEQRFKVEMVTGEPDPIILKRAENSWIIENYGGRAFSGEVFQDIEKKIEAFLASIR